MKFTISKSKEKYGYNYRIDFGKTYGVYYSKTRDDARNIVRMLKNEWANTNSINTPWATIAHTE